MKNNKLYVTLIGAITLLGFLMAPQAAIAHSPKYVDIKYYGELGTNEGILSLYVTHGVSNTSYHYVYNIQVEYYEYNASTIAEMEEFGKYVVQEGYGDSHYNVDVIAVPALEYANQTANFNIPHDNQSTDEYQHNADQIFHHNYTLSEHTSAVVNHYTLIQVTAYCNLGGSYTHSILAGQIWWDIEHSMLEAVVPTLVCAVIILSPLVWWVVRSKNKEKKASMKEEQK